MTYFHEKTLFGIGGVLAWCISTLGVVLVEDEALRFFYALGDGAGKTKIMVKFATGAAQQLAIEP